MPRILSIAILLLLAGICRAQNIGIGTNTPIDKLTVQTAANNFGITHTDGTIRVSTFVGGGQGGGWIGTQSNHPFHFYTNNGVTPNLTLNPSFINDFRGLKPWTRWFDGSIESGSIRSNGSNIELAASKASGIFSTPGNLILQTGDFNPPFQDDRAGLIGVGTRTPLYKFQVEQDGWGIMQSNGVLRAGFYVAGGGGWLATQSLHPLYFCTGLLNGNNIAQMMVATNGNVGIGTLNPTYKLSVNGNIRSKEVVVESGWADYVFDKKYRLRTLEEVEQFIKTNNHLPNIPSAKEIEENGLALGDVQKRMMEKIEELTLYVIELKKEIETLKKSNH